MGLLDVVSQHAISLTPGACGMGTILIPVSGARKPRLWLSYGVTGYMVCSPGQCAEGCTSWKTVGSCSSVNSPCLPRGSIPGCSLTDPYRPSLGQAHQLQERGAQRRHMRPGVSCPSGANLEEMSAKPTLRVSLKITGPFKKVRARKGKGRRRTCSRLERRQVNKGVFLAAGRGQACGRRYLESVGGI